jgi:hypothetical protein
MSGMPAGVVSERRRRDAPAFTTSASRTGIFIANAHHQERMGWTMIPTWMIEEIERQRRERERRDRPELLIELPVRPFHERPTRSGPASPVVIDFGDTKALGA